MEGNARIEEREVAQAVGEGVVVVDGGCEYTAVGFECDRCACVVALAGYHKLGGGLAAAVFLSVDVAVAAYFGAKVGRERVDTRNTYTVETARNFIRAFVEFTAGMEHCEHDFKSALVLFLVHVYRDTAAVVDYSDGIVFVDSNVDFFGKTCQSLVDTIVHHLVDKVVQTFFGNVADIHCRALADCLEPFKHLNVTGAVFLFVFCHIVCLYLAQRRRARAIGQYLLVLFLIIQSYKFFLT